MHDFTGYAKISVMRTVNEVLTWEISILFFVPMLLLDWLDAVELTVLIAVGEWASRTKFCTLLSTGTSGDRWIDASYDEVGDRSFELECMSRDSLLHWVEELAPTWFFLANASNESSAVLKFSWCWICWRIHLDNPNEKKLVHYNQTYFI